MCCYNTVWQPILQRQIGGEHVRFKMFTNSLG